LAALSKSGGDFVIEADNNQPSDDTQVVTILLASSPRDCQPDDNQPRDGAQVLTIAFASSPWDCQAELAATPISAIKKKRARLRNIRPPIDGLSLEN
jgi:hypothetical protein